MQRLCVHSLGCSSIRPQCRGPSRNGPQNRPGRAHAQASVALDPVQSALRHRRSQSIEDIESKHLLRSDSVESPPPSPSSEDPSPPSPTTPAPPTPSPSSWILLTGLGAIGILICYADRSNISTAIIPMCTAIPTPPSPEPPILAPNLPRFRSLPTLSPFCSRSVPTLSPFCSRSVPTLAQPSGSTGRSRSADSSCPPSTLDTC